MSHFNLLYYTILYRTVPYFKKSNNRLAAEQFSIFLDVVRVLFPNVPAQIQLKPTEISDQELEDAGLGPYVERIINANGSRCRVIQLTFRLLLSKSPSFYHGEKKISRPVERLRIVFRKKYLA